MCSVPIPDQRTGELPYPTNKSFRGRSHYLLSGSTSGLSKVPDTAENNPAGAFGKEYRISLRYMVLFLSTVVLQTQGKDLKMCNRRIQTGHVLKGSQTTVKHVFKVVCNFLRAYSLGKIQLCHLLEFDTKGKRTYLLRKLKRGEIQANKI